MTRNFPNLFLVLSFLFLTFVSLFKVVEEPLGRLEGELFPVVNPYLTITKMEYIDEYTTKIHGTAVKVRDCDYLHESLKWNLGTPDRHVGVTAYFKDKPAVNGEGDLAWESIIVGLSKEQILTNSFATVQHDCGWWWRTTSLFFSSEKTRDYGREEATN